MAAKKRSGADRLPPAFAAWFAARGWVPRAHQLEVIARAREGRSLLLIAPTGAGKTLAGFLPGLIELCPEGAESAPPAGLHTLYISPLKALAVDIARNLAAPIAGMELPLRVETRTGDTPPSRRQRQRFDPPHMLMTTPEQLALMLSHGDAARLFSGLRTVILDELHSLVTSKRGDLLALGLARLRALAPRMRAIGLSATVAAPRELCTFLVAQGEGMAPAEADLIDAGPGPRPEIGLIATSERVPWAGHSARHAFGDIYDAISRHDTTLVFVNTRSQAEMIFQALWRINDDNLPIALHHGSLDVGQRRKVEAAMARGELSAVVCTSTLDLGVDWGDVNLVVNVGAPKGASRLAQRIGRANHRLDEPSRALLVPANRFEVMECQAAMEASAEGAQDSPPARRGALDVLAQHILGRACAGPFEAGALYREVASAAPYSALPRADFDRAIDFVATGGYALRAYERHARIRQRADGLWRLSHPRIATRYRMNVGTIVEAPMLKVRLARSTRARGGGRLLGEIEEWFAEQLSPGDTFLFAGEVLRFEGLVENEARVTRSQDEAPRIPSYQGGKFPLSTYLAERVRDMLATPRSWPRLPGEVAGWLSLQRHFSAIPRRDQMLVETFPRADKFYLVCYPFEGRLAHQTLGMLLTRRLERAQARPLGFVASEYALAVWGLRDLSRLIAEKSLLLDELFDEDMLGDDLDAWLAESNLMKRTFRSCATIAGLIERHYPGVEKTGRQMTVSSDLIYDVLRSHEPDHLLLRAAWEDAASGLLDIVRLGGLLKRVRGHILHKALDRVSPLAVPVMLEIGREPIHGAAHEELLGEAAEKLAGEAGLE